jgi:hypothetical protein
MRLRRTRLRRLRRRLLFLGWTRPGLLVLRMTFSGLCGPVRATGRIRNGTKTLNSMRYINKRGANRFPVAPLASSNAPPG